MVLVPLAPWATDTDAGEDESVKPAATLAFTVSDTVVDAVSALEVPVTVTVVVPVAAVLVAENVTWLDPLVGFVPNIAETPLGRLPAVRVTLPVNPFTGVTVIVSAALPPCVREREAVDGAIVKLPGSALTVSAMVVEAVSVPEVPVMVIVAVPVAAELDAVSVSTLEPVVGFVPKTAVTPLGRPLAARVTLPVNPFAPVIVMVSAVLLPCVIETVDADGAIVKLGAMLTVSPMDVEAVSAPEVPVMVTVVVPVAAVLAAVRVSMLEPVVGLVAKSAVTPLGRPLAASVTPLENPDTSVTEIVSVALLPCVIDKVGAEGASVKLGGALTVRAIDVIVDRSPEAPVMVTALSPSVAEALAVNVTTLEPVAGLVANAAVTPVGNPETANVTSPVNPFAGVIVIVSVAALA